jgi:chemotaxis family two-component system response regulator Rcp1
MPHYYFDLTDGVTRRDRNGLDCTDDAAAITKAISIACEVTAAGKNCHSDLHISIMRRGHEVSRVPVLVNQAAPATLDTISPLASQTVPLVMGRGSRIQILLVEDRPGDTRLTTEAFHHHGKPLQLNHAWDGAEALDFLKRNGRFGDAPRPDLILLDLDLAGMRGTEVLAGIKGDPHLSTIPTIIFTTSDSPADILACYKLRANCYLQKPANWDDFEFLVTCIGRFWLSRDQLPQMRKGRDNTA